MFKIITCYTLFDCTQTGVRHRNKLPDNIDVLTYQYQRNTQANLDTILQVISLRGQPEIINKPTFKLDTLKDKKFGFMYEISHEQCNIWSFDFEVQHADVFDDGAESFGLLNKDCDKIPMIKCNNEHPNLTNFLDISPELRNIYFEIK